MRRYYLLILGMVCLAQSVAAAPAYGTRFPRPRQFFGGVQFHRIADRELEGAYGHFQSAQYFAQLSYGIFHWLALDLKGGFGDTDWRADGYDEIRFPTWLTGGYGGRFKFYETENEKMKLVFGFQHISVHPKSDDIVSDPRGPRFKTVIDDWQFSLLGSYLVAEPLTFYGGGKWNRMDLITWTEGRRKRVNPEDLWGVVLGLDLDITKRMWLNMEADLVDGEAFSVGLNAAF